MDKELEAKTTQWILYARSSTMPDKWIAEQIIQVMKKLGYRKLPPLRAVDIAGILNEYFPYIAAKDKRTTAIGKLLDLFEGKPPKGKRPFSLGFVDEH